MGICVGDSLRILQDVRHLLEQDTVFSLNLSVALLEHLVLLLFCLQMIMLRGCPYFDGRLDVL